MQRPRTGSHYDEQFFWWGSRWEPEPRYDLAHLLRDETISVDAAAVFWAALVRRRSVIVIGGPSQLGKTTLLSAFLPFLPSETRKLHLRGSYETFSFLHDPAIEPRRTALLINEISPHLPIYLWGPGVARVLAAAERGFTLLATAHGESVADFVRSLAGSPLRIPASQIAMAEFVVLLERSASASSGRRVTGIWRLAPQREGLTMTRIAPIPEHDISLEPSTNHPPSTTPPFPTSEIALRSQYLTALRDGEVMDVADFPQELSAPLCFPNAPASASTA